jgi:hypothetical protein
MTFSIAYAQNRVTVAGVVTDAENNPLERASVQFLNAKDSLAVAGGMTGSEGRFGINVVAGKYLVKISFIGYNDAFISIDASKNLIIQKPVVLERLSFELDSAVIIGKALEMVVRGDTVEYSAAAFKVLPSAVVEDLIKKLPGAEIDENGGIKINGKEIKKIYVDKKEFFGDDPKVASRNLPAEIVDKVQVWDKKSDMAELTGFDDGEEETVINLSIRQGMKKGFFGNAAAGIGNRDRYDASVMANYMHENSRLTLLAGVNNVNNDRFSDVATSNLAGLGGGQMSFGGRNGVMKTGAAGLNFAGEFSSKLKLGGNIIYGNTDRDVISNSFSRNYIASGDQLQTNVSEGNNISDNFNVSMRMEWNPDELTKIIFTPNLKTAANSNIQSGRYLTTKDNIEDSINWGQSARLSESSELNVSGNLNISRKFGKKGRTLTFGLSGGLNDRNNDGSNNSKTEYSSQNRNSVITDQIYNMQNGGFNWRLNLSYVEPLGKNNFMQLSYNYRNSYSEQDRQTFKNDGFGSYSIVDTSSTKKLENSFSNHEIRLNFQSVREKYNYTIGVAMQPSSSESRTLTPDTVSTVTNGVLNFAPVLQFIYRWDRQTNLRLNYNGRVNQPSATQLSSIRDESNPLNISYGNPDLKPSFANTFRAQFQKSDRVKGNTITLSSNWSFNFNDIVRYSAVDSVGKRESTYRNVNGNWETTTRLQLNKQFIDRKFSINSTSSFSYSADNGFVNGVKNISGNLTLGETIGGSYRSDIFDLSLRANVRYSGTDNTLEGRNDQKAFNYGGSMNTTLYLPWNLSLESDLNYSANSGYTDGYGLNEWLWNITLQKSVFKNKSGTVRFKMFDVLQQRSNISRSANAQSLRYSSTNILGSYFIIHFIYKLNMFKSAGGDRSAFRRFGNRPEGENGDEYQERRREGGGQRLERRSIDN